MRVRLFALSLTLMLLLAPGLRGVAQDNELAAVLEVLSAGVEVQRVNTTNPIAVRVEAIVGMGDVIRTDNTGRARITFFEDGAETELLPNTEYRIERFQGDAETFQIQVTVLFGQTIQRLGRILNAASSYDVQTPAMILAARGTEFAVRVEEDGRSAMLVTRGLVAADGTDSAADVAVGFGVRTEVDAALSDVVRARSFAELDAALDGCSAELTTPDDVSLNVRQSPDTASALIGNIAAADVTRLFGRTERRGWYRIPFGDGFGWVLSSTARIERDCAGLRIFPNDHQESAGAGAEATPVPGAP
ncbi:MAG: FecR domain-containing protein [Anaerolineae bacterium]|jgi:hypothetical protein|nr:FecR domain-containing protein [Anaerolineae bacterium]